MVDFNDCNELIWKWYMAKLIADFFVEVSNDS